MSMAGKWQVTMDTPIGTQKFVWDFRDAGAGGWSGTMDAPTGPSELRDIRIVGSNVDFNTKVSSPMGQLDLAFSGAVSGTQIAGTCRTQFGTFQFSGQRG